MVDIFDADEDRVVHNIAAGEEVRVTLQKVKDGCFVCWVKVHLEDV